MELYILIRESQLRKVLRMTYNLENVHQLYRDVCVLSGGVGQWWGEGSRVGFRGGDKT